MVPFMFEVCGQLSTGTPNSFVISLLQLDYVISVLDVLKACSDTSHFAAEAFAIPTRTVCSYITSLEPIVKDVSLEYDLLVKRSASLTRTNGYQISSHYARNKNIKLAINLIKMQDKFSGIFIMNGEHHGQTHGFKFELATTNGEGVPADKALAMQT
jgi:hypothetical protein